MARPKNPKGVPPSKEEVLKMGKELVKWSLSDIEEPTSKKLSLRRFFFLKGWHVRSALKWTHKYPEFKESYDLARLIIGDKREAGMIDKRFSEKAIMFSLHNYLDDWKEATEYHAKLRNQEEGTGEIHLHLDSLVKKEKSELVSKDPDNSQ